eukprot:4128696-Pyramimonas_sp.AAC.1
MAASRAAATTCSGTPTGKGMNFIPGGGGAGGEADAAKPAGFAPFNCCSPPFGAGVSVVWPVLLPSGFLTLPDVASGSWGFVHI